MALVAGSVWALGADRQPAPEPLQKHRPAAISEKQKAALAKVPKTAIAPPGMDVTRPTDCLIEPSAVVKVNSGVEGVVKAIYVERGDDVRRGQIVARLDSSVERAAASAAGARASNNHAERAAASRAAYLASLDKRTSSVARYLAADKVEEARANAQAASEERSAAAKDQQVARLEAAHAQRIVAQKTVVSPVNGIVTERAMEPGEYRGADVTHILTIAQVDPLRVEVFAPISALGTVELGDEVAIYPEEPVGGRYLAKVRIIDRVFDAASGTFGMRLDLPNPDHKLPAGLRCRIEIAGAPDANGREGG